VESAPGTAFHRELAPAVESNLYKHLRVRPARPSL